MDNEPVTVQDLISLSYEQKPIEFENAFNSLILDRVAKAVDDKKIEVAQFMFNPQEEDSEVEDESEFDAETETEFESETEEDLEQDQEEVTDGETA